MAEAAAKEPSMEDILASIRKIIAQDDPRVKPEVPPMRLETLNGAPPSSHERTPPGQSAQPPLTAAAPQAPAQQAPQQAPQQAMGQPTYRTQTSPRPNSAVTLAALASQVRQEMPRGPAPQPQPAPRAPAPQAAPAQAAPAQSTPAQAAPTQAAPTQAAQLQAAPVQSYRPLEAVAQRAAQQGETGTMSLAALAASVSAAGPAASVPATAAPAMAAPTVPAQAASVGPRPGPAPTLAHVAPAASVPVETAQASKEAKPVLAQAAEVNAFRDALVSPSTGRLVGDSMDRLKAAVADDTSAKVEAVLRPMLREWLDANLPGMVERLVREEIERIARA